MIGLPRTGGVRYKDTTREKLPFLAARVGQAPKSRIRLYEDRK